MSDRVSVENPLSQVTILIHTANRAEQLYRLLRYYAAVPEMTACTILIADGSGAESMAKFDALMASAKFDIAYELRRFPETLSFPRRLQTIIEDVTTPYVMLAADDDFYFMDAIHDMVGEFDRRENVTAIVGNYLVFGLNSFTAFSESVSIADGGPERFSIPWLEGETADARVAELASNPHGIQTIAWYAIHRTDALARIYQHSQKYDLPTLLFERFYTVAQAASGKTHFSPAIFLARQSDANLNDNAWRVEPLSLAKQEAALKEMEACALTFFTDVLKIDEARAANLVATAFASEIGMMKQADNRRMLRWLVNTLGLRRWLTKLRHVAPPQPRDRRLPQACDPKEMGIRSEQVRLACLPDEMVVT